MDTLGLPVAVVVHAADIQDRDGGLEVIALAHSKCDTLNLVWGDGAYAGSTIERVRATTGITLEIVRRSDATARALWLQEGEEVPTSEGFEVLPWRWIVYLRVARALPATEQGLRGVDLQFGSLDTPRPRLDVGPAARSIGRPSASAET